MWVLGYWDQFEVVGDVFEVHCGKRKESLDMGLPSRPVSASAQVVVGLCFVRFHESFLKASADEWRN